MKLTPSWICSFLINLSLTVDIVTSKLCRNWKLSSWNPYSCKKPLILLILIKAFCDPSNIHFYSHCCVYVSSSSCKIILYISASFLGPLHMLIKEDDLDSSTLVQRSYLIYHPLCQFDILYFVSPPRVMGIIWEGNRFEKEWQKTCFSVPCVFNFPC